MSRKCTGNVTSRQGADAQMYRSGCAWGRGSCYTAARSLMTENRCQRGGHISARLAEASAFEVRLSVPGEPMSHRLLFCARRVFNGTPSGSSSPILRSRVGDSGNETVDMPPAGLVLGFGPTCPREPCTRIRADSGSGSTTIRCPMNAGQAITHTCGSASGASARPAPGSARIG